MSAVSTIQSPVIMPKSIDDSGCKNIQLKIICALVMSVVVGIFCVLLPMNSITLSFLAGCTIGGIGTLFSIPQGELAVFSLIFSVIHTAYL